MTGGMNVQPFQDQYLKNPLYLILVMLTTGLTVVALLVEVSNLLMSLRFLFRM